MDIRSHNYVATPGEISKLASAIFASDQTSSTGRVTYLKALVATTQEALPKGKAERAVALAALEEVNERFYELVLKAAQATLPPRVADRALLLNQRTNFARSSVTTVRAYIRAGNDLARLNPRFVTKRSLAVPVRTTPATPKRMKARVERMSKALVAQVLLLAEADKPTAVAELNVLLSQIAAQLESLGVHATKLRGGAMYVPLTNTQVIRQQASPS